MFHSAIDQRSRELDRVVIRRLRDNPALLDKAKANLARWMSDGSEKVRPDILRWRERLDGDFEMLLHFLATDSVEATRLRQSSPLGERNEVLP